MINYKDSRICFPSKRVKFSFGNRLRNSRSLWSWQGLAYLSVASLVFNRKSKVFIEPSNLAASASTGSLLKSLAAISPPLLLLTRFLGVSLHIGTLHIHQLCQGYLRAEFEAHALWVSPLQDYFPVTTETLNSELCLLNSVWLLLSAEA